MGIRLAVVLVLLAWHPVAHAQQPPLRVTNNNDSNDTGTLRRAIQNAIEGAGNTIVIEATGTIELMSPLPTVNVSVTITGPGAGQLSIFGVEKSPVFMMTNGTVQLSGVTISGGANNGGQDSNGNGGGIAVTGGSLTLLDSVITGNSALIGSGIYSVGTLTIKHCTISDNTGTGAAVYGGGDTTVVDSTIANNQGTAIVFPMLAQMLTINRSTISGNKGGLELQGGMASIRSSTFSGNAGAASGEIATSAGVMLSLVNVTVTGASGPALLFDPGSTVTLRNTLFAGTGVRCSPGSLPTSQGHNLSSDATCNLTSATDKPGVDPGLGPLAANGGGTMTHAPRAGSAALNAGDGAPPDAIDQRGKPRVQFGALDIGAVEVTEPVVSTQPVPQSVMEGEPFTLAVVAMNQNSATPLTFQWRKDGALIAGATSATFTKPDAEVADAGMYDVLVINDGGSLPSMAAAVTVTAAPIDNLSDSGGCCSSSGEGAWSSALLGLVLAVLLGVPRDRRVRRCR
jgi:hypothetical protein